MSLTKIALLIGMILSLILIIAVIVYLIIHYKNRNPQLTVKPKGEMFQLFKGWMIVFCIFFITLVFIFCLSMFIVEMTK